MMFDRYETPWISFTNLEHADRAVWVRADTILAIEDGPSGVNVLLFGGSFVRVKGPAKIIKAQIDQFWIDWEVGDEARRQARHKACEAAAAKAKEPK
jgi:hypothetical protein